MRDNNTMGKTIVVLGGGVGGLVAASNLQRHLGKAHRIVLIDKKKEHVFQPSFLWVMLGQREPTNISRGLERLSKKGIEFVNAEVQSIDTANRVVKTTARDFKYDYLVVALGAELAPDAVPGFSNAAFNLYNLDGAMKLRDALRDFRGGKIVILIARLPFKCPAAPYETAFLLDNHFSSRGMRGKVTLQVFTPEPFPMPVAGQEVGNQLKQMLEQHSIAFNPNHKVASVDAQKRTIVFENGATAGFDLLVGIPPHVPPRVLKESGFVDETGWISVDKKTLSTKYENVYALGDVAAIKLATGALLPKAGVFAHGEAEVVAHNIAAEIKGRAERKEFDGHGACFVDMGSVAAYGSGRFFAEPKPEVTLRKPSRIWHVGKVLFEKYWLWKWF